MPGRREIVRDEAGVEAKFSVRPASIPDYLALVGDSADGYPGIAGWGEKGASAVLSQYRHLEDIPKDWRSWPTSLRRARALAETLFTDWDQALLFRTLARLRLDVPVFDEVDELQWSGARHEFAGICERIKAPDLLRRAAKAVPMAAK